MYCTEAFALVKPTLFLSPPNCTSPENVFLNGQFMAIWEDAIDGLTEVRAFYI